jgi:hypothetical protein
MEGTPLWPEAPPELTQARLKRLGEGVGKVVYASEHWVVKRDRSPQEIVGLIIVWRAIKRAEHMLPRRLCERLLEKPSRQIRLLRVMAQASMAVVPKAVWYTGRIRGVFREYYTRSMRGERLAQQYLEGTSLVPQKIEFPPTRVRVLGWPGWLTVSEATERVECTLLQKLTQLAESGDFAALEDFLNRFLELRRNGWQRGLFSADAHLKNFGIVGARIVLLDTGGLTNRWTEIEGQLEREQQVEQPHLRLGLGRVLASRPEIAQRFNARWRATVNRETVRQLWPGSGSDILIG